MKAMEGAFLPKASLLRAAVWTCAGFISSAFSKPVYGRDDVGVGLRILPLGDSITYGFASPDGNGYRLRLQQDLAGSELLFVGSHESGTMDDGWNAGYNGNTTSDIEGWATLSFGFNPNIILIHSGTNDLIKNPHNEPFDQAINRLGNLIDECHKAVPDAVLLVARIIGTKQADAQSRINDYNSHIPALVASRIDAGYHALTVDMSSIVGEYDGVHPNEAGYQKMGDIWYQAIKTVVALGWVKPPTGKDPDLAGSSKNHGGSSSGRQVCNGGPQWSNPGAKENAKGGVGHEGPWKWTSNWQQYDNIADGLNLPVEGVHFADMDGDGRADYLWINETGGLVAWLNRVDVANPSGNQKNWVPANGGNAIIASGAGPRSSVFFNDMNGDLKTDYVVVKDGGVTIWFNEGYDANHVNKWNFDGGTFYPISGFNGDPTTTWIADINGDLRDDVMTVGPNGELTAWLNVGKPGSHDVAFHPQGNIASGTGTNFIAQYDVDGDKRDDYLVWGDDGSLKVYLNIRTARDGLPFYSAQGPGSFHSGTGISPRNLRLADIDGDGKVDYLHVYDKTGKVDWYKNNGAADTSRTGDGVFFADLDGDGVDDYCWLDINGALKVYLNAGSNANYPDNWAYLVQNGGSPVLAPAGVQRHQVRFADIDGDGKQDYCVVGDEKGALHCWINNYTPGGGWKWTATPEIATGLGFGPNVRLADLDGDGKWDYIYVHNILDAPPGSQSGAITVYKNVYDPSHPLTDWTPMNVGWNDGGHNLQPIASGVGADPKEIIFHDINGDGRADYIWLHEEDGSVNVWLNQIGEKGQTQGDNVWAAEPFQVASGVSPADSTFDSQGGNFHYSGQSVRFGVMTKSGRADYIAVRPSDGAIYVWFNGCDDLGPGGDSGDGTQPKAPAPLNPPTPTTKMSQVTGPHTTVPVDGWKDVTVTVTEGNPPTPTSWPPWASGSWTAVTCGAKATGSAAAAARLTMGRSPPNINAAKDVWAQSGAAQALSQLITAYRNRDQSIYPKSTTLDYFLIASLTDLSPGSDCGNIATANCFDTPLTCSDYHNSPALVYIAGIFSNINTLYTSWYNNYQSGALDVGDRSNDWVNAFVQQENEQANMIFSQVLSALMTFISLPIEQAFAPITELVGEGISSVLNQALMASISGASSAASSELESMNMPADETLQVQAVVGAVFDATVNAQTNALLELFNGTRSQALNGLADQGALLAPRPDISNPQRQSSIDSLFNTLFQVAWPIASGEYNIPYVLFVPYYVWDCKGGDIDDAGSFTDALRTHSIDSSASDIGVGWRTCDQYNNAYFLLNAGNKAAKHNGAALGTFPGMDQLRPPQSKFGNVAIEDMVISAFRGFVARNFSNTGNAPSFPIDPVHPPTTPPPGFFPFPICTDPERCFDSIDNSTVDGSVWPSVDDGYAGETNLEAVLLGNLNGYAPGSCTITWDLNPDGNVYHSEFYMYDNFHYAIGHQFFDLTIDGPTVPFNSTLPAPVLVGWNDEHQGLYFSYGSDSWDYRDGDAPHSCSFKKGDKGQCSLDCPVAENGIHDYHQWSPLKLSFPAQT